MEKPPDFSDLMQLYKINSIFSGGFMEKNRTASCKKIRARWGSFP
jgi:hypothetical protein